MPYSSRVIDHCTNGLGQWRRDCRSRASDKCESESSGPTVSTHTQSRVKRGTDGEAIVITRLSRPRILKTDFRRNYAIMWANVFNSCDKSLMMQHLQKHYLPDVAVSQNDVREGE
jgi:hypothetical protein